MVNTGEHPIPDHASHEELMTIITEQLEVLQRQARALEKQANAIQTLAKREVVPIDSSTMTEMTEAIQGLDRSVRETHALP